MDAELKARWTAALRSDGLKQAKGRLKDGDAMCCLGVLAHVQGCSWGEKNTPMLGAKPMAIGVKNVLYPQVAGGLSVEAQKALADMNDGGAPFSKIADYIDANL